MPGFGLLPRWEFPFLFVGLFYLFKERKTLLAKTVLLILLITPLPAALVRPSPHTLRVLLMVVPYTIIISVGILYFLSSIKKWQRWAAIVLIPILLFEFLYYLHFYYEHYPKVNLLDWGAANKQMVEKAKEYKSKYPIIVVENTVPFAYDYFRFYDSPFAVITVGNDWKIPGNLNRKDILLIRPYYGQKEHPNLIDTVYLQNVNKDIYVQFWEVDE